MPDLSLVSPRLWIGSAVEVLDYDAIAAYAQGVSTMSIAVVADSRIGIDDAELWADVGIAYRNCGVPEAVEPLPESFFTQAVEFVFEHWQGNSGDVLLLDESTLHRNAALAVAIMLVDGVDFAIAASTVARAAPRTPGSYFGDARRWFVWFSEVQ